MSPIAQSIDNFCERYGISRSQAYEEIRSGRLKAVKLGRRTLVPEEAGQAWLKSLPALISTLSAA